MKKFISYKESINILDATEVGFLSVENVFVSDAIDRVLAVDIKAIQNSPEFETSAMDGYAIRFEDQISGKIKIIDKNPAGSEVSKEVGQNEAIKTFTGSLMPKGADTLIPIENVEVDGEYIEIVSKVPRGFSVRAVGEMYKKDEILIQKNTKISFAEIGVLAGLNIAMVSVYRKPIISVASTGSEILDIAQMQTNKAQIRSSNHLTIEAICKKYGASVYQKGVVSDDKDSITELLTQSLESSDIVVTTGGVSVGDYDFVKDIIKTKLGATVLFQGVYIKPGQHLIVAKKENKFIVGLPGFAYSSTVTTLLYVVYLIDRFYHRKSSLKVVKAKLQHDIKTADKTVFIACDVVYQDGAYLVSTQHKKSGTSAILTNMLDGSGLIVVEQDITSMTAGDMVDLILLD